MLRRFQSLPYPISQFLPFALILGAVAAAYSNTLQNIFLWDDIWLIVQNRFLHDWDEVGRIFLTSVMAGSNHAGSYYRPMQILLYLIVEQTFGGGAASFHILNILLHAANACLIFILGCKLGFRRQGAFVGALIWAVHPLHTEAVTYISATADVLYAFFCLLGLIILLPDYSRRRILLGAFFFTLALLTKESAIIFPLLALCNRFLTSQDRRQFRKYVCIWPFCLMAMGYLVLRLDVLNFSNLKLYTQPNIYTEHLIYRIYTFLAALPLYLQLIIWPVGLHPERQFPIYDSFENIDVILGSLILILIVGLLFWGKLHRGLVASWAALWFIGAMAPNSGIAFPLNANFMEHWMYLPSIGIFLGVTEFLSLAFQRLKLKWLKLFLPCSVVFLVIFLVILLIQMTFIQNKSWHDQVKLYTDILKYEPGSERTYNNLGMAYAERGDYEKAAKNLQRSIEISDTMPEAHHNLALVMLQQPDWTSHIPAIITELQQSLKIDPDFYPSVEQLEKIYVYLGEPEKVEFYRTRAETIRNHFSQ